MMTEAETRGDCSTRWTSGPKDVRSTSSVSDRRASSASRQVSAGRPQESPKSSKSRQEIGRQGLYYSAKTEARVARAFTGDTTGKPGRSRSGGFKSPFAEGTLRSGLAHDSRNEGAYRDVGLPWNNREGTNPHVSSNRHPEFLLAGPLLSADRAGQATAIARPRGGLLPGGRPGIAHPGRWAAVPPDRPARLPPRLAPRARRGMRQARRTRRAALRDSRNRDEVADDLPGRAGRDPR